MVNIFCYDIMQVFHVNQQRIFFHEAYFSLERPLVAQRLQLNIHNSVFESSNRSCWTLKLLGCTFSEGIYGQSIAAGGRY